MKTLITLVFTVLFSTLCLAQNGINYKAIIKDASGNVVANTSITVQFTILQGVAQTNVYRETHSPTTNANGLIIINIGEGTPVSGTFNAINWASDTTFLNTKINTGAGLVNMGTTEFKTVPYAINAANVTGLEKITEGSNTGWRLKGQNQDYYGDIGINAIDLSYSNNTSTTKGATGFASTAMGLGIIASGDYSAAMGSGTEASGNYSTAMGSNTTASEFFSTAMGAGTVASGSSSTAMGASTIASGGNSTAMGASTVASGISSTAMGGNTTASGSRSTAMGYYTTASGSHSTAMGYYSTAESSNSLAIGRFNVGLGNPTLWVETDPLFEIGNGTSSVAKTNALTVLKNGTILAPSFDLAEITDPKALITKEFADTNLGAKGLEAIDEGNGIGWRLKGRNPNNYGNIGANAVDLSYSYNASGTRGATGNSSTALGNGTIASGGSSTAMGYYTTASENYSTAMGYLTTASGTKSTSMGDSTTASGQSSTAMGGSTTASGTKTTAMGLNTTASGFASTSMGYNTTASGEYSTAIGYNNLASGEDATAMGLSTTASGNTSTAMGRFTTASSYASLAIGQYNVGGGNATSWVATDPLFEVGFGTDSPSLVKRNAITVLKSGMVGIGTATPKTFLHLTNGYDASLASGTGYFMIGQETGINLLFDNNEIMVRNNGAASSLLLQQDGGNVYVGGALVHSSDRRLKKDITPLSYGLETILKLNPVAYNWINRTQDHKSLGLIAQEVQPIISEVVSVADDEAKTLGVSYTELIPVLIKAIQEQQEIISSQDSKINTLTAELDELKTLDTRVKQLESLLKTSNQ